MKLNKAFTLIGSFLVIASLNLSATLVIWDGNSDSDGDGVSWNDGLNWDNNTGPGDGDEARFLNNANVPSTVTLSANVEIDKMTVYRPGTTIGGGTSAITFSPTTNTTGILTSSTGDITIAAPVNLTGIDGATSVIIQNNSSGKLILSNTMTLDNANTQINGGPIEINGNVEGVNGDEAIRINTTGVLFGSGTKSNDSIVLLNGSSLSITGGIVSVAKIQANSTTTASTLSLDGANVVSGSNVALGTGGAIFTIDVNADQGNFGLLTPNGGTLTIDVTDGYSIAFANSSLEDWTGSTISIAGFAEGLVRFGTDATGLTIDQLALIDGGAYSLDVSGFLTAVPEPETFALISGFLVLGLVLRRRSKL